MIEAGIAAGFPIRCRCRCCPGVYQGRIALGAWLGFHSPQSSVFICSSNGTEALPVVLVIPAPTIGYLPLPSSPLRLLTPSRSCLSCTRFSFPRLTHPYLAPLLCPILTLPSHVFLSPLWPFFPYLPLHSSFILPCPLLSLLSSPLPPVSLSDPASFARLSCSSMAILPLLAPPFAPHLPLFLSIILLLPLLPLPLLPILTSNSP